ncbi:MULTISPECIES: alpha/beta fold hydrolase [Nocardia]|uniref:Alpha/beta hydrolase n=2 Tax=Nocardia TaxID=1817 RepID=A0A2T2ZCE7_9NOCA|nr:MULTISPECIES: alpha/beta hydrolase [Nocardia]PSR65406.1 alpha/beta hydrolase [Nocardia nova]
MSRRTDHRQDELDIRIRAAEADGYAVHGVTGTERMVELESGLGPVRTRLTEFGTADERPPVVLLHGIASATVLAAPLLPYLRDRRVIAVDWPGHGLSDACVLPPGVDLRAHCTAVLDSLLDDIGAPTADIVGHSMGAQFALYGAAELGNRIGRLVLLGAPGAAFDGVKPIPVMWLLAMPKAGPLFLSMPMSERAFERSNDLTLGRDALRDVSAELVLALRLIGGRARNAASIASFFRALVKRSSVRPHVMVPTDVLARLRRPIQFVWGDDDVFLKPLAAAQSIVAVREVSLLRLPGAGHAPWLQAPERTGRAMADHLLV